MSRNAGYDETLLASAPVASKSQLQSGYSIDILREKKRPLPRRQDLDGAELTTPAVPFRTRPFYRTKRGLIIIFIGFIALVAVIVGAAVGSRKKKSKATDNGVAPIASKGPSPVPPTSVTPTLTSRTFTWTFTPPGGIPTVITSVLPPGIGISEGRAPTATPTS